MDTNSSSLFMGEKDELRIFNGQAIINGSILFFYNDCDETEFDFPNYAGLFMTIGNERDGDILKSFTSSSGLSKSGNAILLNLSASDMTLPDLGKYYYEIGYIISGGYEQVLRYGDLYAE